MEGGWKEISRSAKAPAPSLPEGGQFVQTNQENDPGDTFSVPHLLHAGGRAQFLSRHALVEWGWVGGRGDGGVAKWQEEKAGSIALGSSNVCSGHTHLLRISSLTINRLVLFLLGGICFSPVSS